MDFNQFVDEVKGGIKQFLPIEYEDAQVRIEEIKKLNENYLGMTVLKENQVIAPTFNLNQLYKMYQSDPEVSMGSILRSITELVLDVPEQFNPKSITEYENAKKKLFIRVSSAEKNEEMSRIIFDENVMSTDEFNRLNQDIYGMPEHYAREITVEKNGVEGYQKIFQNFTDHLLKGEVIY